MSRVTERGKIELGGLTFDVSAFTFDQLQEMMPLFDRLNINADAAKAKAFDPSDIKTTTINDCREIIKIATGMSVEQQGEIKTNLIELFSAVGTIAHTSGLVAVGEMVRGMAARENPAS